MSTLRKNFKNTAEWIEDNWIPTALILAVALFIVVVIYCAIENNKLNKSMVGRPRAALIEAFGPPTRTAPSYEGSEVIEWVRHDPGYFQTQFHSNGQGGGYTTQIWIPPRDVIRRAIVRNGRVASCEGGF